MLFPQKTQGDKGNPRRKNVLRVLYLCIGALGGLLLLNSSVQRAAAQAGHSATLSWTYTQGSDVAVGFNVLRSTTSGGPYTVENSTLIPLATLTYTDSAVTAGTTYFYVLNAQDANGNLSANSPQVSAAIPGNPSVPTGIVVTVK